VCRLVTGHAGVFRALESAIREIPDHHTGAATTSPGRCQEEISDGGLAEPTVETRGERRGKKYALTKEGVEYAEGVLKQWISTK
jgi:DNA-binding PadR family transcriptional regulator